MTKISKITKATKKSIIPRDIFAVHTPMNALLVEQ